MNRTIVFVRERAVVFVRERAVIQLSHAHECMLSQRFSLFEIIFFLQSKSVAFTYCVGPHPEQIFYDGRTPEVSHNIVDQSASNLLLNRKAV